MLQFACFYYFFILIIFLDNAVMNTPKRRILSLVFTVLCFKNNNNRGNLDANKKLSKGRKLKGTRCEQNYSGAGPRLTLISD